MTCILMSTAFAANTWRVQRTSSCSFHR